MCGICGIVTVDSSIVPDRALVERMRDLIAHRGPDGAGLYLAPGVGLGHRRLSILDVAHGQQPMYSENRRFVIVYNGEVFNHPALKPELEAAGVRYRTRSDTETVLHLYERLQARAVERMRGMFAVAIWDSLERRLFLARDRYGVKPLYYVHRPDGSLIFGSEIKALLPALEGRPVLNREALPDFLANHAPSGEATLFAGIMRLPPGHTLTWENGRISMRQYWDIHFADALEAPPPGSPAERAIVDEYRQRFTEAVRLRLMSDVPLGMFLSGGFDSAATPAPRRPPGKRRSGTSRLPLPSAKPTSSNMPGSSPRPFAPSIARSSSRPRSSLQSCHVWCGTRMSRSRIPRASHSISCRGWPRVTSRSCSLARAAMRRSRATIVIP